jgi:NAD(P)-dependent dehydrogenase (short-subunit alcohol dehydrogenase family)
VTTVVDPFGLSGRVAVVTGAAQGIGRACAASLARAGADVALCDLDGPGAAGAAAAVGDDFGVRTFGTAADVTDVSQMAAFAAQVHDELGAPAAWVHNAGGMGGRPTVPVVDVDVDDWDAVVRINLRGSFVACQAGARAIRRGPDGGRGGAIVLIASLQGVVAAPHLSAYAAAKAGVVHLTRTLALELAPDIRVNGVAPSFTETPATRAVVTPERKAASEAAIPLRRVGQPDDIAGLVTVLASPIAAFVTGQTLIADGGLSLTTARPTRDRE